ncbi:hypothetical protein ACEPPN_017925 [Leptodophora sp. 'Broadleaf-Isolate-01']
MEDLSYIQPYSYSPLSQQNQEFRLLRLLPKSQRERLHNESVECSIVTTTVDIAPRYYALSYVWGRSDDMKPLLVNSKLLNITANLDAALRCLRDLDYVESSYIWIDAVCINQANNVEKSWQVEFMTNIYSDAVCTLSWLGPACQKLSFAITTIKGMYVDLNRGHSSYFDRFAEILDCSEETMLSEEYKSVRKFLRLEYFQRLWILQEISVAKEVRVVCGTLELRWEILSVVLEAYAQRVRETNKESLSGSETLIEMAKRMAKTGCFHSFRLPSIFRIGMRVERNPSFFSLESLLWRTKSTMKCSNPRDYVYGLLGLVDSTLATDLRPNYGMKTHDCFIFAAKALLLGEGLGVLSMCHQPKLLEGLPSWTPDFSSRWTQSSSLLDPFKSPENIDIIDKSFYTAGKATSPSLSFEKLGTEHIMTIAGAVYASVADVWTHTVHDEGKKLVLVRSIYNLGSVLVSTLRFLLSLNIPRDNRPYASKFSTIARLARRDAEPGVANVKLTKETHAADVLLLRKLWDIGIASAEPTNEDVFEHGARALSLLNGLIGNLFITASGSLGISPLQLQAGDIVTIFCGAKVPYIIREAKTDSYQFICEAFIDGIMYGEALIEGIEMVYFKVF